MKKTEQTPQNVLSLESAGAMDFFMNMDSYCGFELPAYFDFNPVLDFVRKKVGEKPFEKCVGPIGPEKMGNVSLEFMMNKDGKYAVRPLTLVNPYLYYFLVREICSDPNWSVVKSCFDSYAVEGFHVSSLPVIPA